MRTSGLTLACAGLFLAAGALAADAGGPAASDSDWPQWRGARRDGVWRGVKLPAKLAAGAVTERWRVPVGGGYSGVAVAGGRVFTLDRAKEPVPSERVLCFDRETGKLSWSHSYPADYGDLDHGNGPRSTPLVHRGRLYSFGAVGHLFCLEADTGRVVWSRDTVKADGARLPIWGHAASPVAAADLLFIQAGGRPGGTLMAFDLATGSERWRAFDDRPGYSTPILADVGGKEELVYWSADAGYGILPRSGEVQWRVPFRTSEYDVAIIPPVLIDGQLFLSGYWDGSEAHDVTAAGGPRLLWKQKRAPSCLMAAPLHRAGHLYVVDRRDGLLCVEWKSGRVVWSDKHQLTPKDTNPQASLVWAGVGDDAPAAALNALGELVLARLSPDGYQELGRVPVVGPTWAHPAFAGQEVFARSDKQLVCVRLRSGDLKGASGEAPSE